MSATSHAELRAVAAVPAPPGATGPAQYLTFLLGGEMYAVMIATPAASFEARRAVIAKIIDSIAIAPR